MPTLTSLQESAVKKFRDKAYGALFTDMGTGKTRALLEIARSDDPALILYVCPNSLVHQVKQEAETIGVAVSVYSYEAIAGSDRVYLEVLDLARACRGMTIIADESTALKNESKTTERMMSLRRLASRALIATATPITNDELDLYNQLSFLSPRVLKMTKPDFIRHFYKKITYQKKGMRKPREFFVFSNVNRDYLQTVLDQVSLQGKCEIKFNIKEQRELVPPAPKTTAEFGPRRDSVIAKLKEGALEDAEALNFLAWANAHFANDPHKNNEVANRLGRSHTVCFSAYRAEQEAIRAKLKKQGVVPLVINGDTPNVERERVLDEFAATRDTPLLITYGVGGRGLNLQHANRIVFSSLTFDWEKMEHARGRIARLGQTSPDLTYEYVLSDSPISRMILDNLEKKTKITELVKEILENV